MKQFTRNADFRNKHPLVFRHPSHCVDTSFYMNMFTVSNSHPTTKTLKVCKSYSPTPHACISSEDIKREAQQ